MTNNDNLRSLRFILNINNKKMVEIFALSGLKLPLKDVEDFLKPEEDPQYIRCDDAAMAHFLDGLIFLKRGHDETKPRIPFELPMTNNIVLKKLRVAFMLKEDDMHDILKAAECPLGRAELSALLRKADHPNFRVCQDQVLRYFLKGLKIRIRGA